jgi:branched-chain amino acid transport system permease protein
MATATGVYNTTYRRDFALRHTKAEYTRLALLAVFAVILPFTLDQYWLSYVNLILLAAIAAVGLNILTGYTGLVSLATAGFLGVGAYTTANLTTRAG